jgi:hypothetical protein
VVVALGAEEGEDVFGFAFGVALAGDCCEVCEGDLMAKLCTVGVFVNGKEVWPQDDVYCLPGLEVVVSACIHSQFIQRHSRIGKWGLAHFGLSRSLQHGPGLEYAIEFKTALLIYRRKGIQTEMVPPNCISSLGGRELHACWACLSCTGSICYCVCCLLRSRRGRLHGSCHGGHLFKLLDYPLLVSPSRS